MHFATPSWLWLLWLLPPLVLLFAIAASRRRAAMRRFAEERFVQHIAPQRSPARAAVRAVLLYAALLLMVGAAAGPRWGFAWEEVERRGVDIVVALDLSRSMLSQDLPPDRLTAAKRELRDLLDLLEGDRVGLVVFAGMAFTQVPLTLDYGTFGVFLDQLDPTWVPIGGTDLGAAIDAAAETFMAQDRSSKAILLITDGEDHGGRLQEAAAAAKEQGVHIFVVGIGKPEGVPVPDGAGGFVKDRSGKVVLSKLDEPALKELALTTGGAYVRRSDGVADLEKLYLEDIKGTLQARALTSSRQRRWEERYQWLLLPAFLLLFIETLLGPRRRVGARGGQLPAAASVGAVAALLCLYAPAPARAGWFDDPVRSAHGLHDDGDFDGALELLLRAQTEHPEDRRIDYDIGHTRYRLGAFDDAEAAFRAATSATDRELAADAWYGAGNALFQQGSYLEAITAYEECLSIRPDDEDAAMNRDIAQRAWEKRLEEARDQQEQQDQQPPPEEQQEQDGEASDEQQQSEDGQEGEQQEQRQEQQQGQGYSEQEQEAQNEGSSPEQEDGDEQHDEQSGAEDDGSAEDETPEPAEQEVQTGGKAEAADIDREATEEPPQDQDGEVTHNTVEDPQGEPDRQIVEGALTEEQAETLLRALRADQEARRAERTRREAERGRRAAEKDW